MDSSRERQVDQISDAPVLTGKTVQRRAYEPPRVGVLPLSSVVHAGGSRASDGETSKTAL